ncbi:MAG TPA: hypothetical protein VKR06_04955 [Ktedonosporobacter sp.]|nr:hypothetical protein [Ktedonosporobacter sp.]
MSGLSPRERAFLDEAFERLRTTRRTFTDQEALQSAKLEGYDLRLSFDERFARAEPMQGNIRPHWRLAEQVLANTRLLHELQEGTWDGRNLDEKLLELEQEDQQSYTFYPHDTRMFLNRQGAWEATGERQITLPLGLQEELDTFKERLHASWLALQAPLTVGQVLAMLEELGWQHEGIASVHRCIRSWLLTTAQFRRVGSDYWIPVELLPAEVQHTRLQVPPVRTSGGATDQPTSIDVDLAALTDEEQGRKRQQEKIIFKGTATKSQAVWTATLLSAQVISGFIPIPKAMRGVYPPVMPGEERITVIKGLWYEDATALWLWLDRTHHRLYGPDLLDKIGWLEAGSKLRIVWDADEGIVFHDAGLDQDVQREQTRLRDLVELKKQRGGVGENYRQAVQALLTGTPEGLTFKEIVHTISQRQNHEVARTTIRSVLGSGGFIHRGERWFAAPDTRIGARQLKEALLETLVPQPEQDRALSLSHHEYVQTRVKAIHNRLQEITSALREDTKP